jgi:hypothetical protein
MVLGILSSVIGIYFSIKISQGITGAVLNPTVALTNVTFCAIVEDSTAVLKFLFPYFFGPVLGNLIALAMFKYFSLPVHMHYHKDKLLKVSFRKIAFSSELGSPDQSPTRISVFNDENENLRAEINTYDMTSFEEQPVNLNKNSFSKSRTQNLDKSFNMV